MAEVAPPWMSPGDTETLALATLHERHVGIRWD